MINAKIKITFKMNNVMMDTALKKLNNTINNTLIPKFLSLVAFLLLLGLAKGH